MSSIPSSREWVGGQPLPIWVAVAKGTGRIAALPDLIILPGFNPDQRPRHEEQTLDPLDTTLSTRHFAIEEVPAAYLGKSKKTVRPLTEVLSDALSAPSACALNLALYSPGIVTLGVILGGVPPNQASFIQRIGRAGRRDGNAAVFAIADASPDGHDQYFFANRDEPALFDASAGDLAENLMTARQYGYQTSKWHTVCLKTNVKRFASNTRTACIAERKWFRLVRPLTEETGQQSSISTTSHRGTTSTRSLFAPGSCNASKGKLEIDVWFESNYCQDRNITRATVADPVRAYHWS
jgi:hypothetical protein